ncbi:MAG TPA: hypothetical protein VM143_13160 [Acidimicrobiales bacterium]|nr:hypothetical protein [Acidimicrobiales bacterium]
METDLASELVELLQQLIRNAGVYDGSLRLSTEMCRAAINDVLG